MIICNSLFSLTFQNPKCIIICLLECVIGPAKTEQIYIYVQINKSTFLGGDKQFFVSFYESIKVTVGKI